MIHQLSTAVYFQCWILGQMLININIVYIVLLLEYLFGF
jgi:hypothetical protein